MRNVFTALTKLIGLWIFTLGFPYIGYALGTIMNGWENYMPSHYIPLAGLYLVVTGVCFFFAWLLVFKTDWVADKVRVPRDEGAGIPVERSVLFPMGIQLLGLYFLFMVIPALIWNLTNTPLIAQIFYPDAYRYREGNEIWKAIGDGLPQILQICLALVCLFKADAIVRVITGDRASIKKWAKIISIILAVVVFLALVGQIASCVR